jgi:hypothetical protein
MLTILLNAAFEILELLRVLDVVGSKHFRHTSRGMLEYYLELAMSTSFHFFSDIINN